MCFGETFYNCFVICRNRVNQKFDLFYERRLRLSIHLSVYLYFRKVVIKERKVRIKN